MMGNEGNQVMDDFWSFFVDFQDHAAPRLDMYEQAIYLYVARQTLATEPREAVIGFKSARKKMAFGVGKAGTAPSEGVIYEKLKGLERKGFLRILSSERTGTKVRLFLPAEIAGVIPKQAKEAEVGLEEIDFFSDPAHRRLILLRDGHRCFYCLRNLDDNNYVIEHVVSRPAGTNSYRNLVASCRQCNNRKDAGTAEDHVRLLYREGLLSQEELSERLTDLERLARGELKPDWPIHLTD
jgi:hypothetical protein